MQREINQLKSVIAGDAPIAQVGDIKIRPASALSLTVLGLLGNPFAAVFAGSLDVKEALKNEYALTELLWVQGADEEEVCELTLKAAYDPDEVKRAVMRFCAQIPIVKLPELFAAVKGDAGDVQSSQVNIKDDATKDSKNAPSHP